MSRNIADFSFGYLPILAISPAEMSAIEELPEKDKDKILPIIPIRGWVGSIRLSKSISRIEKAINNRPWIADLDRAFLEHPKSKDPTTGEFTREVFKEISDLFAPESGYGNWFAYIKMHENAIPSLICIEDTKQLEAQLDNLNSLGRGIAVRFTIDDIDSKRYRSVLEMMNRLKANDARVIFDYGKVQHDTLELAPQIAGIFSDAHSILSSAQYSLSCASFPDSFAGTTHGANSIYERLLFNKVANLLGGLSLTYSDRGGARADKFNGGSGVPAPRIDYPQKNEWHFIRKEFSNPTNPDIDERGRLYTLIAREIMEEEYWNPSLHVWGTQIIEYTSKGEMIGINSPVKATAVRLNIHMYNQLHYNEEIADIDADDEWVD